MTRPLKLMNLSAALNLVVADTSETDVARRRPALREKFERMGFFLPEASESRGDPIAKLNKKSSDSWLTRESAVLRMESAIADGKIEIYARDPKSDALFHVDSRDWKGAAYREQSLRGGTFRASACDSLEKYHGWDALADMESLERWLAEEKSRRPVADESKCRTWLLEAMLASPRQKIRSEARLADRGETTLRSVYPRLQQSLELRRQDERIKLGPAGSTSQIVEIIGTSNLLRERSCGRSRITYSLGWLG